MLLLVLTRALVRIILQVRYYKKVLLLSYDLLNHNNSKRANHHP